MSLTDARHFYVLMRDAAEQGVHSHALRRMGVSGNPSQRAKDIASKGVGVCTVRENVGNRPGSRYWLRQFAPDFAVDVKPNGPEGGGEDRITPSVRSAAQALRDDAPAPTTALSAETMCLFRDFTKPDGTWEIKPLGQVRVA